ncbi:hypothetical protein Tco_0513546 [Tanacetum coccineum]
MWLFRHKYHADASRHKARYLANDSTQLEGVDVDETISPVVKPDGLYASASRILGFCAVTPLNLGSNGMLNIQGRYFIDQ